MEQLRLHWEPIWSWPVVGLVTVVAALTVWLGYRMAAGLPPGRRQLLLGVRMATLLVLVIAMIRPQLQWISPEGDQPRVWVVGDASRSMSVLDGPGGISRRQAFLQLLESLDSPLTQLSREVELEQYDFAEKPVVQQEWSDAAEGQQTALGELLREVSRSHAQRPIASVFLFSDGAQRALPPFDLDPREAARELGELGIAVYPVPIGQAVSTADAADVAVDEIQVDPVVFVKKRVPVRVSVRWTGAGGQKLRVRLMLEDRSGLRMEQVGPLKPIPRSEFATPELEFEPRYPNGSQVFELSFTPELSGEFKLAAQVEPIPGEVQTRNNVRETLITVRQGGLRVAYFDIFRTEVKSIRQLNASDQMQIDFQLVRSGAARGSGVIDARWFEPGRYDVFIIGDVAADQFAPAAMTQLAQRIREGAGLMMLGGYQTYSAGGYADSPLREVLPIQLNRAEQLPPGQVDARQQIQADLKLQPTAAGNRHFVTRIDSVAENQAAWQELPPLSGATRIRAKSDFVEVLATSGTGDHLIVAAETGRSRVMCLAFDQTYLWSQAGFDEAHRRFWRQAVLWLAHKELETDLPIWLTVLPKAIDPGGRVTLEYGARDEEGNPLAGVQFQTQVKTPDGKAVPVNGTPTELGAAAGFTETVVPGDYFVSVDARMNGNSLGLPAQARFLVHDRDLELDYPIVDRGMLSDIAQQAGLSTDSRLINPENLEEFLADYLKRKPWKSQLEVTRSLNLWDGWPVLLMFSLLMTIEWVLRKQGGLV